MKRPALGVLMVGVLVLAGAWHLAGHLADTPRSVIERFLDGMQEMDEQKILSTIDPAVRDAERGKVETMLQGFRQLTRRGARVRISHRRIEVEADNGQVCGANVSYTLSIEVGGQSQHQDVREKMMLFRDHGHWYRRLNAMRTP